MLETTKAPEGPGRRLTPRAPAETTAVQCSDITDVLGEAATFLGALAVECGAFDQELVDLADRLAREARAPFWAGVRRADRDEHVPSPRGFAESVPRLETIAVLACGGRVL